MPRCSVSGCDKKHQARGFCSGHYQRFLKYGDPLGGPPRKNVPGTPKERFWRYVSRGSEGDCWEWSGAIGNNGYGRFGVAADKVVQAHRFSFELHSGEEAPAGMDVCHRCDNRRCVNPAHLFLGTRKANMEDMVKKGRHVRAAAILTEAEVREIKRSEDRGVDLAARFGVSKATISMIRKGERWGRIE